MKAGRAKVSLVPEVATQLTRVYAVHVEHHAFFGVRFYTLSRTKAGRTNVSLVPEEATQLTRVWVYTWNTIYF